MSEAKYSSCIGHVAKSGVTVVHEDYLALCGGDHCRAKLLKLFEYETTIKLQHRDQAEIHNRAAIESGKPPSQVTDLWIYKTEAQLARDLLDEYGVKRIREGLHYLLDKGFIERRTNPEYWGDKRLQYRLNTDKIDLIFKKIDLPKWRSFYYSPLRKQLEEARNNRIKDKKKSGNNAPPSQPSENSNPQRNNHLVRDGKTAVSIRQNRRFDTANPPLRHGKSGSLDAAKSPLRYGDFAATCLKELREEKEYKEKNLNTHRSSLPDAVRTTQEPPERTPVPAPVPAPAPAPVSVAIPIPVPVPTPEPVREEKESRKEEKNCVCDASVSTFTFQKEQPEKKQTVTMGGKQYNGYCPTLPEVTTEQEAYHQQLIEHYENSFGAIGDMAEQLDAIEWLYQNNYAADKAKKCFTAFVKQHKKFGGWRDGRVSWISVKKGIGAWVTTGEEEELKPAKTRAEERKAKAHSVIDAAVARAKQLNNRGAIR